MERLGEVEIEPSVGCVGESYDHTMVETIFACARIGAVHSVVFGGFAWWLARRVIARGDPDGEKAQPEPFARQARLFQLLHHRR